MNLLEGLPELEAELKQVNAHLERLCHSNSESMQRIMEWVLTNRGKQIRPVLTLLCSKLKGKRVNATETAAVIEICHTASLIHDDIIDGADLRRGQLSVQKKFGPEMAVYAGDFMIFAAIAHTQLVNKLWYRSMFAKLGVMCDGEVSQYDNQYNTSITEETYIRNIIGKTSAMFQIACGAGAWEGGCSISDRRAVDRFAVDFGLLFQLRDDLSDFTAPDGGSLKSVHNDFWYGYYTLPAIHTFRHPEYGAELKQIAEDLKAGPCPEAVETRIIELIRLAGGDQYTLALIEKYAREAVEQLDRFHDTPAKRKLIELVHSLLSSAKKIRL